MNKKEIPDYPGKDNEDKKKISRRDFLKIAGGGAAGLVLAEGTKKAVDEARYALDSLDYQENKKEPDRISTEENKNIEEPKEFHPSEDDIRAVREKIGPYDKKAVLDKNFSQSIQQYWRQAYEEKPKLRQSLESAYQNMQPYIAKLKEIFRNEFADLIAKGKIDATQCEELAYLAIPESHWDWKKDSPKGARGPYQIMVGTGRKFGLRIDKGVKLKSFRAERKDERLDIWKSTRAAAQILREVYDRTADASGVGDMKVTLAGYDADYINPYLGQCHLAGCRADYNDYLAHLERKINDTKNIILHGRYWKYKVQPQDHTLKNVADRFGLRPDDIAAHNQLKMDKFRRGYIIHRGQTLQIPMDQPEVKRMIYERQLDGFIENLNYPEKYAVIMELVRDKEAQAEARQKLAGAYEKQK